MSLRGLRTIALWCGTAAALALGSAACGQEEAEPTREGLAVDVGGVDYNVYITRQLNPRSTSDADYYQGPPPAPGFALYGVFLQACNRGKETKALASEFKVTDSQGNEFEPVELPKENVFAYEPRRLRGEECVPEAGSAAATGPIGGSMLLFRLPLAATENRPLELEIEDPHAAGEGGHGAARVELDI